MKDSLPEKLELNLKTKIAYGVGELGGAIPNNILVFYVLFFLTNVAGLNSTLAGGVLLVAKAWDAINDPLIGWLSDRTRSRLGRRYPWMLVGAIPLGLFFFLQWVVPPIDNQWLLFSYYTAIAILFYASISSVLVPFSSLAAEITQSYDERTSLVTVKSTFWIGGSIFVLALAQVIFARVEAPTSYLILGACCGFLATLSVYLSVFGTYERYKIMQGRRRQVEEPEKIPVLKQIKIALSNKPFLYVIGIYLCSWLGVQVTAAILPYFVIDWMGLSKSHFSQMALTVQISSLLAMFFWGAIAQRFGKKAIYCMGIPLTICAQAGLFFIQPGQISLMYVLAVLAGVGLSTAYIVPWSMLPD
ncbi:MAG: MFS transporter, partial [Cyanobacteria bacterium J06639_18]